MVEHVGTGYSYKNEPEECREQGDARADWLEQFIEDQRNADIACIQELKKHLRGRRYGYLFETRNGTPLRLSNVLEDKLQPVLRKLKLVQPGMGMHAFRRGRISHLVYSGVSRQVIRDWCGEWHASASCCKLTI